MTNPADHPCAESQRRPPRTGRRVPPVEGRGAPPPHPDGHLHRPAPPRRRRREGPHPPRRRLGPPPRTLRGGRDAPSRAPTSSPPSATGNATAATPSAARPRSLAEDPTGIVATLEESAFGCDWLTPQMGPAPRPRPRPPRLDHRRDPPGHPADRPSPRGAGPPRRPRRLTSSSPPRESSTTVPRPSPTRRSPRSPPWPTREIARLLTAPGRRLVGRRGPLAHRRPRQRPAVPTSASGRLRHRYTQDAERLIGRSLDLLTKFRKAEQAAAELPDRTFGPAPAARPADPAAAERPAASGVPAEAPPSRNEPKSAGPETETTIRNLQPTNEFHVDPPSVNPPTTPGAPRRPSSTATAARPQGARPAPATVPDRRRPPSSPRPSAIGPAMAAL